MRKPWYDGGYSAESIDDFIALGNTYEPSSLLFPLEMAIDQKRGRVGLEGLTMAEQTILAVEALEREVNDGGYGQFFTNSSGEFAPMIVDCLNRIDCPEVANLTQSAIHALGTIELDAKSLSDAVERQEVNRALDECDRRYYSEGEDIGGKLFEFISANRYAVLR
jgi:hypothetical protein